MTGIMQGRNQSERAVLRLSKDNIQVDDKKKKKKIKNRKTFHSFKTGKQEVMQVTDRNWKPQRQISNKRIFSDVATLEAKFLWLAFKHKH